MFWSFYIFFYDAFIKHYPNGPKLISKLDKQQLDDEDTHDPPPPKDDNLIQKEGD